VCSFILPRQFIGGETRIVFELFRYPELTPAWYTGHNYHLTDVYGTNLNAWFASPIGKTAFGADFRSENIWSNVLGKPLDKPIPVPGESGKEFTKVRHPDKFQSVCRTLCLSAKITASAGVMANWNSHLGQKWNLYPGIE